MKIFLTQKGPPFGFSKKFEKLQYLLRMYIDEKSFLDQFLILYIIKVQKLPIFCAFNFVRAYQPHVDFRLCFFPCLLRISAKMFYMFQNRNTRIVDSTQIYSSLNPIGPGRFFDACVPGRGVFSPPLKKLFFTIETHGFWP